MQSDRGHYADLYESALLLKEYLQQLSDCFQFYSSLLAIWTGHTPLEDFWGDTPTQQSVLRLNPNLNFHLQLGHFDINHMFFTTNNDAIL